MIYSCPFCKVSLDEDSTSIYCCNLQCKMIFVFYKDSSKTRVSVCNDDSDNEIILHLALDKAIEKVKKLRIF